MPAEILVTCATRSGSTQEVAAAIVKAMRDSGREVELLPARNVKSLDGFKMIVLGAPLYMFHWHKDALGFLRRHQGALRNLPVAVFALGPFHDVEKEWTEIRAQLDKELAAFPWFAPVAREVFGGKFDPATLRFPMNMIPALRKMPASDIRNWDAIRAWAIGLAESF
jgi:menaquinone-dependent protoporphyrinogen oxidase